MLPGLTPIDVSLALAGLAWATSTPQERLREAILLARASACSLLHLDGTQPGLRARELDRSARRDVAANLRREGLGFSGLDLWIPPAHFAQAEHADRAVDAVVNACELAAEIARLNPGGPVPAICLELPTNGARPGVVDALATSAASQGVVIADFSPLLPTTDSTSKAAPVALTAGLDPAAEIMAGRDPEAALASLGQRCGCVRLTDAAGFGRAPVGSGRLDLPALRATLSVTTGLRCVVLDLRGLPEQAVAAKQGVLAWSRA